MAAPARLARSGSGGTPRPPRAGERRGRSGPPARATTTSCSVDHDSRPHSTSPAPTPRRSTRSNAISSPRRERGRNPSSIRRAGPATRFRRLTVALAALLVVAVVAGALLLVERSRADDSAARAKKQAVASSASSLATEACSLIDEDPDLALLLAVEARRLHPSVDTDGTVDTALVTGLAGVEAAITLEPQAQPYANLSPDGRLVAVAGVDGFVRLLDVDTGRVLRRLSGPQIIAPVDPVFNRDGTLLAVGSDEGKIRVWNVATGRQVVRPLADAGWPVGVRGLRPRGRATAPHGRVRRHRLTLGPARAEGAVRPTCSRSAPQPRSTPSCSCSRPTANGSSSAIRGSVRRLPGTSTAARCCRSCPARPARSARTVKPSSPRTAVRSRCGTCSRVRWCPPAAILSPSTPGTSSR